MVWFWNGMKCMLEELTAFSLSSDSNSPLPVNIRWDSDNSARLNASSNSKGFFLGSNLPANKKTVS